jgi:hypothetical protein
MQVTTACAARIRLPDRFREEKRDRWVSPEELAKLAQAIDAEPNPAHPTREN